LLRYVAEQLSTTASRRWSVNLIPLSGNGLMVPPDWQSAGRVLCIPGSMSSGYEGWATMVLTLDALAIITPAGAEEKISLDAIEDVTVRKFEGILIERQTSVGTVLSPLPYPHGLEVCHTNEIRMKLRLQVVTLAGNAAHTWAVDIRRAAQAAQLRVMSGMMPQRRPLDNP
jgi:hypothetical protein